MNPKPLSDAVKKGLAYLVGQQHTTGGWSQGGGWRTATEGGRVEGPNVEDPPDVANTCVATLALLRAENTPRAGECAPNVVRALDFIVGQVERSDAESLYVTELRDTQVQCKIGPFADTFLAAMVLAEARGQMPDEASECRLSAALDRVIGKMERHQQNNGTWAMGGWAPVVGQSLAAAGLGRARQRGAKVADEVLEKAEKHARAQYDPASKKHSLEGSAGVPLYGKASHLSAAQRSIDSYQASKVQLRTMTESPTASPDEKAQAAERLKYIGEAEEAQAQAMAGSYADFADTGFTAGFGSNGGEEFLSYLNIGETLAVKGGEEWEKWDRSMTDNLTHIQNGDGSWAGHHCITGRTFCTATALLVLMADRAPRVEPVIM